MLKHLGVCPRILNVFIVSLVAREGKDLIQYFLSLASKLNYKKERKLCGPSPKVFGNSLIVYFTFVFCVFCRLKSLKYLLKGKHLQITACVCVNLHVLGVCVCCRAVEGKGIFAKFFFPCRRKEHYVDASKVKIRKVGEVKNWHLPWLQPSCMFSTHSKHILQRNNSANVNEISPFPNSFITSITSYIIKTYLSLPVSTGCLVKSRTNSKF